LSGLIDEGQKGALRSERGEKMPRRIPQPDDSREHGKEDSKQHERR
jgi:hypothetical protein